MIDFTVASYTSPTTGTATIPLIHASALIHSFFICSKNTYFTHVIYFFDIDGSSGFSLHFLDHFTTGPDHSADKFLSINIFTILGACGFTSSLLPVCIHTSHPEYVNVLCVLVPSAWRITSMLNPSTLISICTPQIPSLVPVTLKSISPR